MRSGEAVRLANIPDTVAGQVTHVEVQG